MGTSTEVRTIRSHEDPTVTVRGQHERPSVASFKHRAVSEYKPSRSYSKLEMVMLLHIAALIASTGGPPAGSPRAHALALLKQMTLEEKVTLLHGPPTGPCCQCKGNASCAYVGNVAAIPRLKIPPITMNDGPQGFRDNNQPSSTTAWPSGLTMAASWDVDAMEKWGVGMGKEFYNKGSNVQLGPGLCLARVPRNGRNFEYLSGEDLMLGYILSQPAIRGIQSEGVIANAKH